MSKWKSVRIKDNLFAAVERLMELQKKTFTYYVNQSLAKMLNIPLDENDGNEEEE